MVADISTQLPLLTQSLQGLATTVGISTCPVGATPLKLIFGNAGDRYVGASPPLVQFPYMNGASGQAPFWATTPDAYQGSEIIEHLIGLQQQIEDSRRAVDEGTDFDSLGNVGKAIFHLKDKNTPRIQGMFSLLFEANSEETPPLTAAALYATAIEIATEQLEELKDASEGERVVTEKELGEMKEVIAKQHADALRLWNSTGYVKGENLGKTHINSQIALNMAILHAYHAGAPESVLAAAMRSAELFVKLQDPLEAAARFLLGALWYASLANSPTFKGIEKVYESLDRLGGALWQHYTPNLPGSDDAMESTDEAAPKTSPEMLAKVDEAKAMALEILYSLGVERAREKAAAIELDPDHSVEIPDLISSHDFGRQYVALWDSQIGASADNREFLAGISAEMAYGTRHSLLRQAAAANSAEWLEWRAMEKWFERLSSRIQSLLKATGAPL